jgi:hypothetical protein
LLFGADGRYIGGATLIEDKGLLVSAAEILTVEARYVVAWVKLMIDTILYLILSVVCPLLGDGLADYRRIKYPFRVRYGPYPPTSALCRSAIHIGRM